MPDNKLWPHQNTLTPADLVAYYRRGPTWERTRFWFENWRKTTALIDPPPAWEAIDPHMQIAMCAITATVAQAAAMCEREACAEIAESWYGLADEPAADITNRIYARSIRVPNLDELEEAKKCVGRM